MRNCLPTGLWRVRTLPDSITLSIPTRFPGHSTERHVQKQTEVDVPTNSSLTRQNAVLEREVQVACEVGRDGFEATGAKNRELQTRRPSPSCARHSMPSGTMSASSHRWASPFHTDELVDWALTEVAVHRYGRFGRHRGTRLVHRNSMTSECTTVRGESGTMMRHILPAHGVAASLAVAALALGMTMPTASGLLVPASCCAQRIASGEAATVRSAVLLSAITARADEHLTSASGTWKASGIVHRSPRRGADSSIPRPGTARQGSRA